MEFTVSKQELSKALHKIVGVIPTKTTLPILTNLLLELKEKILTVTGTDLEISVSISIPVDTVEEGDITVSARILNDIVREFPDIPLRISTDETQKITIVTEKGLYRISGQSKDDYPKITIEETPTKIDIPSSIFYRLINKTTFAVSADALRPVLTGIYTELLTDELRLVATDGHRLAKAVFQKENINKEENSFIIPPKALNLVSKTIEEGCEQVNMSIAENHVVFELNNTIIYSKLIEGQYPNYDKVIPTSNEKVMIVSKDILLSTLRRVAIFSSSMTHQVRFSFSDNNLTISSEDIEIGGEAKENIPVEYNDEKMDIGYNALYIIDILRHINSDTVKFELHDSLTAAIIRSTEVREAEDFLALIMPIRLSEE